MARKDVRVVFPQEAHGLSRGFSQPPWSPGEILNDYLPKVQAAVVKTWMARKKLVATFAARHSVLEYDAQDFTMINLFMKVGRHDVGVGVGGVGWGGFTCDDAKQPTCVR